MSDQCTSWENAAGEIGRLQAQVLAHLLVERLRQVARRRAGRRAVRARSRSAGITCRQYVTSSASTRLSVGLHLVQRAAERLDGTSANAGRLPLQEAGRRSARWTYGGRRGSPTSDSATRGSPTRRRRRAACAQTTDRSDARTDRARTRAGTDRIPWDVVVVEARRERMSLIAIDTSNGLHRVVEAPGLVLHPPRFGIPTETRCCAGAGNEPRRHESSTGSRSATARIIGTSRSFSRSKMTCTSAVVIPRS